MKNTIAALALAAALLSPLLAGDDGDKDKRAAEPQSLQHDLVVTATRIETPSREIASSLTVLTREVLARSKKTTVLEALEESAGVSSIRSGGPGAAATIMLRGSNSEHTLVLLDGVELNDPMNPSRTCDLTHLRLDQVERIEILRGPQSTLYGSDALGGVVNIITRKGDGPLGVDLTSRAGSMKTVDGALDVSGALAKGHFSFGASWFSSEGISAADASFPGNTEKDGYRNLTLMSRAGWKIRPNTDLDLSFRLLSARTELDNFGGYAGDDPNNVQRLASMSVVAHLRRLSRNGRWESKLDISFAGSDRKYDNPADASHPYDSETGRYRSSLVKTDWQNNFFFSSSHTLTAGAEFERERGSSSYVSESAWGPSSTPFPARTSSTAGFYVQDQIRAGNHLAASAGIRLDNHDRSGAAVTFRIAPAWLIPSTGTKIKGTFGTGFKAPSLYQLYAPGTSWGPIGNAGLKAEESAGWDAGVEQELFEGRMRIGAVRFSNRFHNLIVYDASSGYVNVNRAESEGFEFTALATPAEAFSLQAAYTRQKTKNSDTGSPLLRRPENQFTASAFGRIFGKFDWAGSFVLSGRRIDLDYTGWPAAEVVLPSTAVLNATISYEAGKRLELFLRLENILGRRRETVFGYGTPGFCAYVGIHMTTR